MFKVKKHCTSGTCTRHVIEWPSAADEDGIPNVGLIWPGQGAAISMIFPHEEDADRVCGYLNKAMHAPKEGPN